MSLIQRLTSPVIQPVARRLIGRGGDDFPLSLPGLLEWFDPNLNVTLTTGTVSQWVGRSVNEFILFNPTKADQYGYDVGQTPAAIVGDGTANALGGFGTFGLTGSAAMTIFFVFRFALPTLQSGQAVLYILGLTIFSIVRVFKSTGGGLHRLGIGGDLFDAIPIAGQKHLLTITIPSGTFGGAQRLWLDGVEASRVVTSTQTLNLLDDASFYGSQNVGGVNDVEGDMFDWAICDNVLSDIDRTDGDDFFKDKHGIT